MEQVSCLEQSVYRGEPRTLREEEPMDERTTLFHFALLAFSSLFSIVNPVSTAPLFLTMTEGDPPDKRQRMAWRASVTAWTTLTLFALLGEAVLQLFSITIGAFRIAGGALLFSIGMDMIRVQQSREKQTPEEIYEGAEKDDVAIIPLAIPMLLLLAVIALTCVASYFILRSSQYVIRLLGQTGLSRPSRAACCRSTALG